MTVRVLVADDARFRTNGDRMKNLAALTPILGEELKKRPSADWIREFEAAGVPVGPVNRIGDMLADPQVAAREMVVGNVPADGCFAPTMLRLMMRPPPCFFIGGIAARAVRICANTLMSMSFCHALSSTTSNGRCPVPPALFTTASMRP